MPPTIGPRVIGSRGPVPAGRVDQIASLRHPPAVQGDPSVQRDLGDLGPENIGLPGPAGAVDRIRLRAREHLPHHRRVVDHPVKLQPAAREPLDGPLVAPHEPHFVHLSWAVRRLSAAQAKYIRLFYGEEALRI